jgi:hypothetical protein
MYQYGDAKDFEPNLYGVRYFCHCIISPHMQSYSVTFVQHLYWQTMCEHLMHVLPCTGNLVMLVTL